MAFFLAVGPHDDAVVVFEEAAVLAPGQGDALFASPGHFEQAAFLAGVGTGQGAGAQQVAGTEVAAVDRVVCDQLGDVPVGVFEIAAREHMGVVTGGAGFAGA